MLLDWIKLLPSLVLLLVPVALFHGERVRYRAVMRDWEGYWGKTFALGLHSIDFGRAALGAWWLAESLTRAPEAQGVMRYAPLIVQTVVLTLATALQTLFCKEPDEAHAPFAFVSGLVIGFLPPLMPSLTPTIIAGFALLLAIVVTAGTRSGAVYFPMLAAGVVGMGALFLQKKFLLPLIPLACGVALPWLLTLLFPRHFVSSYLHTKHSHDSNNPLPPPR